MFSFTFAGKLYSNTVDGRNPADQSGMYLESIFEKN